MSERPRRWIVMERHLSPVGPAATFQNPSSTDIREAMERLGREESNDLSVDLYDDDWQLVQPYPFDDKRTCGLIVSGDVERLSVAFVQRDDEGGWSPDFIMLTDPSRGDGEEPHLTGGGLAPLPARSRVSRRVATDAVLFFCAHHALDPTLQWEHSLT